MENVRQRIFIFFSIISFNFVINFSCIIMSFLHAPLIFCYFIFYGEIALQPISCTVTMLAAKMFTAKVLMVKIPNKGSQTCYLAIHFQF